MRTPFQLSAWERSIEGGVGLGYGGKGGCPFQRSYRCNLFPHCTEIANTRSFPSPQISFYRLRKRATGDVTRCLIRTWSIRYLCSSHTHTPVLPCAVIYIDCHAAAPRSCLTIFQSINMQIPHPGGTILFVNNQLFFLRIKLVINLCFLNYVHKRHVYF